MRATVASFIGRKAASYDIDEEDCWVLKGRFTPEQGAVIRQALEKAMDALFDEGQDEHPDVSAETPRGNLEEWQQPQPVASRRADALERLTESFLAGESGTASGGDRYVVNIHAEADVFQADGEGAHAECDDGGRVSGAVSGPRRYAAIGQEQRFSMAFDSLAALVSKPAGSAYTAFF